MVAQVASGTQAATAGVTYTLATITTPGVYILRVDTNAINFGQLGSAVDLAVLTEVLAGGTRRIEQYGSFGGEQLEPIAVTAPIAIVHGVQFTLLHRVGAVTSYPWSVLRLDA